MFYFAIPSYKRGNSQITLNYLSKLGYKKEEIIISTQTEDDYKEYLYKYGDKATIIYKNGNSVGENRNNILEHFKIGDKIVMLDDDIKSLVKLSNDGKIYNISDKSTMDKLINSFFKYCENNNSNLWGVYPVCNNYFMSMTIDKKNILIGCVLGIINFGEKFDAEYRTKEDYEFCCRELSNGRNCIRFNNVSANAKHKTNSGGCKDDWKFEINKKCADMLISKYPLLIKRNSKKQDEVRYIGK